MGLIGAFLYPLIAVLLLVWLIVFYVVQKPAAVFQDENFRQEYFKLSPREKWRLKRKKFLAYLLVPFLAALPALGILQGYGWWLQGSAYASWKAGDKKAAVQSWEKVVAMPSGSEKWVAEYNLGTVALLDQDYQKATKLLNQAWDNMPFLPGVYTSPEAFISACQVARNQILANPNLQRVFHQQKPHNFSTADYENLDLSCGKQAFANLTALLKESNPEKLKSKKYLEAKKFARENQEILAFLSKSSGK